MRFLRQAKIALFFAPAVLLLFGWFIESRWLLAAWIVLTVWLVCLYAASFFIGLAHGSARDFEPLFIALGITGVAEIALLIVGLRQRRARLIEQSYIPASEL